MRSRIPDNGKKTDIHILQKRITQAVLTGSGNIPVIQIGMIKTNIEAIKTVPPQIVKNAPSIFFAINYFVINQSMGVKPFCIR